MDSTESQNCTAFSPVSTTASGRPIRLSRGRAAQRLSPPPRPSKSTKGKRYEVEKAMDKRLMKQNKNPGRKSIITSGSKSQSLKRRRVTSRESTAASSRAPAIPAYAPSSSPPTVESSPPGTLVLNVPLTSDSQVINEPSTSTPPSNEPFTSSTINELSTSDTSASNETSTFLTTATDESSTSGTIVLSEPLTSDSPTINASLTSTPPSNEPFTSSTINEPSKSDTSASNQPTSSSTPPSNGFSTSGTSTIAQIRQHLSSYQTGPCVVNIDNIFIFGNPLNENFIRSVLMLQQNYLNQNGVNQPREKVNQNVELNPQPSAEIPAQAPTDNKQIIKFNENVTVYAYKRDPVIIDEAEYAGDDKANYSDGDDDEIELTPEQRQLYLAIHGAQERQYYAESGEAAENGEEEAQ